MNNEQKLARVIEYEQLLKSVGCKTVFKGGENQGFQRLMFDPNSGVVFSVEAIPRIGSVEIRTSNSQKNEFPTNSILYGISKEVPLFSQYKEENYWDLPVISIEEEYHLPSYPPMYARVLNLPGAPVDADEAYYQVGQIPGVDDEVLKQEELKYLDDVEKYNQVANEIIHNKMEFLPSSIQQYYDYHSEKRKDIYGLPKQIRR